MAIGNFATGPAPFSQKTLTALTRPRSLHAVAKAKQKQRQETGRSDKIQSLAHSEMHLQSREHPSAGPGTPSSGSGNAHRVREHPPGPRKGEKLREVRKCKARQTQKCLCKP